MKSEHFDQNPRNIVVCLLFSNIDDISMGKYDISYEKPQDVFVQLFLLVSKASETTLQGVWE